jgi:hypothetical protein
MDIEKTLSHLRKKTGLGLELIDNDTILVNKQFKSVEGAKKAATSIINEASKLGLYIKRVEAVLSNGKMTLPYTYNTNVHPHKKTDYQKKGGQREN